MPRRIRLSDAQLVMKAKRVDFLKKRLQKLGMDKAELEQEILTEMARRGTELIESSGVRLKYTAAERVEYDDATILGALTPRKRKLCQKTVFDRKGLESAVMSGVIDAQWVAEHSTVTTNKPYLTVTPIGN